MNRISKSTFLVFLAFLTGLSSPPESQSATSAAEAISSVITPEILVDKPINPFIYGNFIELGIGNQVDGMWAELLFNRSFEVITPKKGAVYDWLESNPGHDFTQEDWWHSGYEEHAWRLVDHNPDAVYRPSRYWGFAHGLQAAHLINESPTETASLAQDGIYLRKGIDYRLRGFFGTGDMARKDVEPVEITAGFYRDEDLKHALIERNWEIRSGDFVSFETVLANTDYTGRATFAVTIGPGQKVKFDNFSLMPSDQVRGWRRDVVEAMKKVHLPILRFPGGCFASFYNWRDGIGSHDQRRPRESEYWGGIENNDVGTAEFIELCHMVGAEPFICVNVMTGSPEEAADWVAYCNADGGQSAGALRERHGHPEPFEVKYWELDNETYRMFSPIAYARRCIEFAEAMKRIDPDIKIVMVGYWRFHDYLAEMLEIAGPSIDLVTDRALDESQLRKDLKIIGEYNRANGTSINLCNTEWLAPQDNTLGVPDGLNRLQTKAESRMSRQNRQIRWHYAMNAARQLLIFQRLGGDFEFANFNNLANTWGQNVINCTNEGVFLSAAGKVFEVLSRSPAAWPLKVETQDVASGIVIQAAWDKEKKDMILTLLNYNKDSRRLHIDLSSLEFKPGKADIVSLSADSPTDFNSQESPDVIRRKRTIEALPPGQSFDSNLPSFSLSHIVLSRQSARPETPSVRRVFSAGDDGINTYRIPSLVTTNSGVLLAFCEARKVSWRDKSPTKLVLKRSFDSGQTWGSMQTLHDIGEDAAMDPTAVVDRRTGRVWLIFEVFPKNWNENQIPGLEYPSVTIFAMSSLDDGETWTEPRNITAWVKLPDWTLCSHGPGVGIQIVKGPHSGRMIIPCHHLGGTVLPKHIFFSDDGGETWQLGNGFINHGGESQIVELMDGSYLMNIRSGTGHRKISISRNHGKTWTPAVTDPALVEPKGCQASFLRYTRTDEGYRKNRLLFSNPAHESIRKNLTIRLSYDEGKTWPVSKILHAGASAYSCLTILPDGTIGVFYERGEEESFTREMGNREAGWMSLTFSRFSLEWLTDNEDRLQKRMFP